MRQLVGRRAAADRAGDITRLAVRDPATGAAGRQGRPAAARERRAEIDDVLTLPDHRGRGYASALVLEAVARAREAGADLVYLEAAEDDWPQHLYVRLGFETVGRIHEHSRTGDRGRTVTDHDREPLVVDGRTVLTFVRTTRDGLDAADLVEPEPGVPLDDVADAVLAAFPGWAVSAPPDLGRLLLDARLHDDPARPLAVPRPRGRPARPGVGHARARRPEPARRRRRASSPRTTSTRPRPPTRPVTPTTSRASPPADRLAKDVTPLLDGTYGPLPRPEPGRPRRGSERHRRTRRRGLHRRRPPGVRPVGGRRLPPSGGRVRRAGSLLLKRCMADLAAAGYTEPRPWPSPTTTPVPEGRTTASASAWSWSP